MMLRIGVLIAISACMGACSSGYSEKYFEKYDICFSKKHPGAGDRFTLITPVMCSNPKLALGPNLGLDFGSLAFEDIDQDKVPEVIVESSAWKCRWDGNCFFPSRFILQLQFSKSGKKPHFKITEQKLLENLKAKEISK
jgi:hypothetical protein